MIELRDASFGHGVDGAGEPAVRGVSASFRPGEIVALVGANGSGKSTLARGLCAMRLRCAGTVLVDGLDASSSEEARLEVRRLVGFVQQDPYDQLVSTLVFDEVAFGPRNLGLAPDEVSARVEHALRLVGLEDCERCETSALSGGQQQRLALAGVLAMRPRYLVLDEPTSQMDSTARPAFRSLIDRLARTEGYGVVLVTHDPLEMVLADRALLLEAGELAWQGTLDESFSSCPSIWRELVLDTLCARALQRAHAGGASMAEVRTPGDLARWLVAHPAASGGLLRIDAPGSRRAGEPGSRRAEAPGSDGVAGGLSLHGVGYGYAGAGAPTLRDVDLDVPAGSVTLLAGPSGSGKSTLACVASGLFAPDRGSALLAGAPSAPYRCALSFQRPENQLFQMSVVDELLFAPRNRGLAADEALRVVRAAARRLDISEGLFEASPFELSGGQARRVGIACALTMGPEALVLDEPTAGLDAPGRRALHGVVREVASQGMPVLVISHDLDEWLSVADGVALMDGGAIRWHGSAAELAVDPEPYRAAGIEPPDGVRLALELAQEGVGR